MRWSFLACGVFFFLGACSDDDSSSSSSKGDVCRFSGTLSGGLEGAMSANACSTSSGADFAFAELNSSTKTSRGMRVTLVTPLKGGETGPQVVKSVELFESSSDGTGTQEWSSTSCSIELTKSEHSPTEVFENRYLLEGRGTCASAFTPVAPNTRAPVTITPFEFGAFIDP